MTNGQKLRRFVFEILSAHKKHLSVSQSMVLESNEGGNYEPKDAEAFLGEVIKLKAGKNWSELVSVYKKLPSTGKGTDIRYYIDGKECSLERFNNMKDNLGVRTFGGKDAPSTETNTMWMSTGTRPDSPYSKGMGGRNSIMKNSTSGSGRQGGINSSDHERM